MRISDWSSDVCSSDLEHARAHKAKKLRKFLTKQDVHFATSEEVEMSDLIALRGVSGAVASALVDTESLPPIIDGAFIPLNRYEEFTNDIGRASGRERVVQSV